MVILESSNGNETERQLKIDYLTKIKDPEILEYLLTITTPDYNHYIETGEYKLRLKNDPILRTVISWEELWSRFYDMLELEGYRNSATSDAGILWWVLRQFNVVPMKREESY